jgi:gamma-polyglutamate biosynthesis protein CapA
MKKAVFTLIFVAAFGVSFSLLESRTVVFRTPTGSAQTVAKTEPKQATLLFVGDLMFDRYIRTVLERDGGDAVLKEVASVLTATDLTIGNLEGPITTNASQSQGTKVGALTNMRFTFSPEVTELLRTHGFDLVSIGNNHINDFGVAGVRSTTSYLAAADIGYVGDPTGTSPEPVVRDVQGISVVFVAYSDFVGGDAARARTALQKTDADVVVVLAHWGNEYETEPPARVRELARSFAEAGADLIIGSHPHVIGSVEDIGTTRVYYSLGNFVFDQYWEPAVRCGLAVKATVTTEGEQTRIEYEETRVGMKDTGATVIGCK